MLKNKIQHWTCSLITYKCYLKMNNSNTVVDNSVNHNDDKLDEKTLKRNKIAIF